MNSSFEVLNSESQIWSVIIQNLKIWGFEVGLEWQKPQNLRIWSCVKDALSF